MVIENLWLPPCKRGAWSNGLRVKCAASKGHAGSHIASDPETREPVFWGRFL